MNEFQASYCRLCAESKHKTEIEDFSSNLEIRKEIIDKLQIFSVKTVDFTDRSLPEFVCIFCLDSLRISFNFIGRIKAAQESLLDLKNNHKINDFKTFGSMNSTNVYIPGYLMKEEIYTCDDSDGEENFNTRFYAALQTSKCYENVEKTRETYGNIVYCDCEEPEPMKDTFENNSKDDSDNSQDAVTKDNFGRIYTANKEAKAANKPVFLNMPHTSKDNSTTFQQKDNEMDALNLTIPKSIETKEASHSAKDKDVAKPKIDSLTCDVCFKTFKVPYRLKYHYLTHTKRSPEYTCDQCGKTFMTKGGAASHQKIHNPDPQDCKICKKTFLNLDRLKNHIKTHSEDKPFQCDNCKRTFKTKRHVGNHMIMHTDVFKYTCKYCEKKFRYKTGWINHENKHIGVKAFVCKVCGRDFTNWSNCNKHMIRIHGITLSKTCLTPIGRIPVNETTGKANEVDVKSKAVREWSDRIMNSTGHRVHGNMN